MKRMFGLFAVMLLACSCANTNVKMVDDQTFLSTDDPNLQIAVASDYELEKESDRRYRFEFFNEEEGRYVLIRYHQRPIHTRNIDHFNNPSTWIFYDLPDCEDIDKGDIMLFDQKWYYRDYVHHESSASCALVRDMGHFTRNYAVLKVIYWQGLPPHKCNSWKGLNQLSADQQEKLDQFLKAHQEDIQMSVYELAAN